MYGNYTQEATKSHTNFEDAQDAQDVNLTLLVSEYKANVPDVLYFFADRYQADSQQSGQKLEDSRMSD